MALTAGATGNVIGDTTAAARNIISGSANQGVFISDSGTTNNVIEGNYIGLTRLGTTPLPNTYCGVGIYHGAQGDLIGGVSASARNIISGNSQQGVVISDTGTNLNLVRGNYIGTLPSGTTAMANGNGGVAVFSGAQSNTIGGSLAGSGNLVSGNTGDGIFVGCSGTNSNVVLGNRIGLNQAGTAMVGNGGAGVSL